jgi:hypothetical protein
MIARTRSNCEVRSEGTVDERPDAVGNDVALSASVGGQSAGTSMRMVQNALGSEFPD